MKSRTATITRLAPALTLALLPVTAAAQGQGPVRPRQTNGVTVPIEGQIGTAPGAEASVPLDGTFTLQRFAQQDDALVAIGTVTLTFTDTATTEPPPDNAAPGDTEAAGTEAADGAEASRTIVSQVAIPVNREQLAAGCPALHIVLDPVDLNLLELTEHLDQVAVDVTAVSEGSQLGTLLCSAANVLNNGAGAGDTGGTETGTGTGTDANTGATAPLGRVVNVLNRILDALG